MNIDVSKTGGYDAATDTFKSGDAAVSIEGTGSVTIELDGMNTVGSGYFRAGVEKNNDGNLTITDANHNNGSLDAMGGDYGAGIGGGEYGDGNNITISGSKINATGGVYGAGIGGGGGTATAAISPSLAARPRPQAAYVVRASAAEPWDMKAILPYRMTHR